VSLYDAQTEDTYARGTFGSRSGFGRRPGVLVVDFCLGMTDPTSPLGSDMTSALAATRRLLDACRARGLPIVYSTVRYDKGCPDGGAFLEKVPALRVFEDGGPWSAIDPRVAPCPGEPIVVKKFASAFFGTSTASIFTSRRCDTVIVTGSTTSGCVRASAVDALQSGFRVVIPRECVADRAPGPHEANLFDLHAKYADVVSLDELLALLVETLPADSLEDQ
jgi:nicotinamidase-related amidase